MRHAIDVHEGLTAPVVLGLMAAFDNWSVGPWVYLALHGTYGLLWILKSRTYPDRIWERPVSTLAGAGIWLGRMLYWLAPLVLVAGWRVPPAWLLAACVAVWGIGLVLHFGADLQKHVALRAGPGLITDGFFSRTRNPNYLGELLIYASFAALSLHWAPWLVLLGVFVTIFVPNMRRKDASLSRYPEWASYEARTGLVLPRLLRGV